MTTITIYKSGNGEYRRLTCDGHADYGAYGKDIVCASISCLTINTVNSLDVLAHEEMDLVTDEKRGLLDCCFRRKLSREGILLMDSLILGLKDIAASYGKKYLELKFKEV